MLVVRFSNWIKKIVIFKPWGQMISIIVPCTDFNYWSLWTIPQLLDCDIKQTWGRQTHLGLAKLHTTGKRVGFKCELDTWPSYWIVNHHAFPRMRWGKYEKRLPESHAPVHLGRTAREWERTPVIPALRRPWLEDCPEFEASLSYLGGLLRKKEGKRKSRRERQRTNQPGRMFSLLIQ